MYPLTILDNFFSDPDKIVEYALEQFYYPSDGNYPGKRTDQIYNLNKNLFSFIGNKIHSIFYESGPERWNMQMHFQLITPFTEDQYHPKNMGWIHYDSGCHFGGIIYLNKNPEKDTGTSVFREKNGYWNLSEDAKLCKSDHYLGKEISDDFYKQKIDESNLQFEETIKIENVYNRMILFGSNIAHGVKTFGHKQDRLTLNFFGFGIYGSQQPLNR